MRDRLDGPARTSQSTWVLTTTVLALVVFYYLARADTIGVSSPQRGWARMTGEALPAWGHFAAAAMILGVLPLGIACLVTHRSPRALGLGVGRWREGLVWIAVGVPLAIVAGRIAAANPAMRGVYPLYPEGLDQTATFAMYALLQLLYYGAWEVLFRGVLLFGLKDPLGGGPANVVQTGLSVTAHFGRALQETLSALPAGLVFGAITLRTRSVWFVALLHWTVGVSMDWFILHGPWG